MSTSIPQNLRPNKGQSIISFPDNYVVIDVETTGYDTRWCEIIEVAAIKYSQGAEVSRFQSLVKPCQLLDDFIIEKTGITNDMLVDAPSKEKVLSELLAFIEQDYIVGYNVNFEINFIYDNLPDGKTISNSFIDALRISRKLLPELENHQQETVAKHFNIPGRELHRSLSDCEYCNNVYLKLKELALEQYGDIESFANSFKQKHKSHPGLKASDVTSNNTEFDETHPLYNKVCVFTGALERMIRKDAMQLVVDLGGICGDNVTKKTNYLILGNNDFCSSIKDGKSNKLKKAESLILSGSDLTIISENVFYDMLDE